MHYQQFFQLGLFHKLIVIIFLSLLVSGEKEETLVVGINNKPPLMKAKQPQKQKQERMRRPSDAIFWSKRKVPNASDPLHNR